MGFEHALCDTRELTFFCCRFKGIVEEPFANFTNWGDLANAELDSLAIPQHRIQFFKYKDTKVWDKKSRLDLIFGSTENEAKKTIEEVMQEVDDRQVM